MIKEIKLASGLISYVSEQDYELVSKFSWWHAKQKKTTYVRTRDIYKGEKRHFYMHQLILGTIGVKAEIDHKDNNGLNNTRDNIKVASHSDNLKNRRKHRGASKYTGVSKHLYNRWIARININGKQKHIGLFDNEIDAAKAYNKAAIETGNPYYVINDI